MMKKWYLELSRYIKNGEERKKEKEITVTYKLINNNLVIEK